MTKIVDPGFQITKVAEDQFGEKWVKVTKDDDSVWISIGRFSESDAYGFKCLGKIGVTPLTPGTKSAAKRYLEEGLEDTEDEIHVALQPGYVFVQKNDAQRVIAYVHASGHTYPVEDADAPDIILGFDPDPSFQTQGNHIAFQEGLGPLVKDQALPILMLTLALAPILQPFIPSELYVENAIVEVCGDGTSGKSAMAIGIAGAVWGGNSTRKTGFFQSWNQTVNKIEQSLGVYNNAMAGFDEATAVSGNKKQRAEAIGNLVHRISLGSGKGRMGEENSPDFRLIAISTSNQPLAQICGEDAQVLQAIETRLITLEVPKRDSKVFDYVPKGFDSAQKATQQFYVIGLQHYGHTAKLLIERTLAMFVKDPHAFQKRAGEMMSHFMKEAGQDKLDLRALRRLNALGYGRPR